jgi:predicted CoA-binding protein
VRRLPQEESGQPLLPGRPDHEVRVGLPGRVQVLGDVVDVEDLDQLLDGLTGLGLAREQLAHGVGDLPAAAVTDRDVDLHAGAPVGPLRGGDQPVAGLARQHVQRTDDPHPPVATRLGQLVDHTLDDLQQRHELRLRPQDVVGGEQPERDELHLRFTAPAEQVRDTVRTGDVAVLDVGEAGLTRPPSVAVENDADVPRVASGGLLDEPLVVEAVDELRGFLAESPPGRCHVPAGYAGWLCTRHTGHMQRTEIDPRWQDLAVIERLVRESRTVAVVGLSAAPGRPSAGVARYLLSAGLTIYPVNPALSSWEGLTAYRSLAEVPKPIDVVDVFRRPEHAPGVAEEAVAAGAGALWLQLGVISPEAATIAAAGGLDVVMDRCFAVEHREVVGWS